MEKINSKLHPNKLLHVIYRKSDFTNGRNDIVDQSHFLQCASLKMGKGKTFRPHKHIWKKRSADVIAQESWVCIKGSVKCFFYDLDDKILETHILKEGDCSFTFEGGHNYEILEDETLVYEFKTGPYEGQEFDKVFLNE